MNCSQTIKVTISNTNSILFKVLVDAILHTWIFYLIERWTEEEIIRNLYIKESDLFGIPPFKEFKLLIYSHTCLETISAPYFVNWGVDKFDVHACWDDIRISFFWHQHGWFLPDFINLILGFPFTFYLLITIFKLNGYLLRNNFI